MAVLLLPARAVGASSVALVALLLSATPGEAQRVTGAVTDARSGQPVAGAVVSLLDSADAAVARTVSDRAGGYVLPVSPEGRSVQARRIGYLPRTVPLPDSAHRGTASVRLSMQPIPQQLPAVVADRACRSEESTGRALALWDQARDGFLAMMVSRDAAPARVRVLRFERERLLPADVITRLGVTLIDTMVTRPFFATRVPADLAERGYIEDNGIVRVYSSPDADVLFDQSFRNSHCFTIARAGRDRSGQIGIAFQPAQGRDRISDVRGTLWLTQSPLALRALQFTYTGGPPEVRSTSGSGHLSFITAANGVGLVDEWSVRADRPTGTRLSPGAVAAEIGGAVLSATWSDGTVFRRRYPSVTGTVVESGTRTPIAGAQITLMHTSYRTVSDGEGRFTLSDVLPGPYVIGAIESGMADFGVVRLHDRDVRVDPDRDASIRLELPSATSAARTRCKDQGTFSGSGPGGIVIGRLFASDGQPIRRTFASYTARLIDGDRLRLAEGFDNNGILTLCGVRSGVLTLLVQSASGDTGSVTIATTGREVVDTVSVTVWPRRGRMPPSPPTDGDEGSAPPHPIPATNTLRLERARR